MGYLIYDILNFLTSMMTKDKLCFYYFLWRRDVCPFSPPTIPPLPPPPPFIYLFIYFLHESLLNHNKQQHQRNCLEKNPQQIYLHFYPQLLHSIQPIRHCANWTIFQLDLLVTDNRDGQLPTDLSITWYNLKRHTVLYINCKIQQKPGLNSTNLTTSTVQSHRFFLSTDSTCTDISKQLIWYLQYI